MLLATKAQSQGPRCEETYFYTAEQNRMELFEEYLFKLLPMTEVKHEATKEDIYYDCPSQTPCDCSESEPLPFEFDFEENYEDA